MKIQKKEEEHLHYTTLKDRKPSLIPNLLVFRASTGLYIDIGLLEDETGPRIEDRRVAPPYGCRVAFSRPN